MVCERYILFFWLHYKSHLRYLNILQLYVYNSSPEKRILNPKFLFSDRAKSLFSTSIRNGRYLYTIWESLCIRIVVYPIFCLKCISMKSNWVFLVSIKNQRRRVEVCYNYFSWLNMHTWYIQLLGRINHNSPFNFNCFK